MAEPRLPSETALLKEYELASNSLHSINTVAYTGTGLFLTISLATAAWFLRTGAGTAWADVLRVGIAAAFSIILVLYWRRWLETLRTQNAISRFRCREIEAELGLNTRRISATLRRSPMLPRTALNTPTLTAPTRLRSTIYERLSNLVSRPLCYHPSGDCGDRKVSKRLSRTPRPKACHYHFSRD